MENQSVGSKTTHLMSTSIKFQKRFVLCLIFFLLITTAKATEYTVNIVPNDQFGASINGEEVVELRDFTSYWQLLLWLATMQILSAIDTLLYPSRIILTIAGFKIKNHVNSFENWDNNRNRIYTFIKTAPGIDFSKIVQNTELNKGTVRYHLVVLKAQNKIEVYKNGNKRYFMENSMYNEKEKKILVTFQDPKNQRIISEILNDNCNTNTALAREIGVSKATINWHMTKLKELNLVKETKSGKNIIYEINPSYRALIERYKVKYDK